MSRWLFAALLFSFASCPLVHGQQSQNFTQDYWSAARDVPLNTIIRGQSPEAMPNDSRHTSELMEIPEYCELLEDFEKAQEEINRLQKNLGSVVSGDDGNHVLPASYFYGSQGGNGGSGGSGGGDVATQSQNPVGGLWMLWFQNDMKLLEGPGDGKRIFNTTVFQPVLPIQLNDT